VRVSFPATALAESAGDINASGPPVVVPGNYVLQLNKNSTTPYAVDVSAPFVIQ
jgi:beta-glucosidase